MTSLASFRELARGRGPVEKQHSTLPDSNSPGVTVSEVFPYQSYFDNTLLEKALLQQSANQLIVDATTPANGAITMMVKSNVAGYAVGLHPSSQTPVAVQPLLGGQTTSPQPVILKPGQIFRPHGKPIPGVNGNFSGVNWGIPFGWLGGGMATLYIFSSPDADVAWSGNPEVVFHRQRLRVYPIGGDIQPSVLPYNWPTRFPWPQAVRDAESVDQKGKPSIAVEPTRMFMKLNLSTLVNACNMRMAIYGSNDFNLDASNSVDNTSLFVDYVWGTYTFIPALTSPFDSMYSVVEGPSEISRLSADAGGLVLFDTSVTQDLAGQYVDIVRYGRLG